MYVWGRNWAGQVGNGDFVDQPRPALINKYDEFWAEVACGETHTGAIGFDSSVYFWGSNRNGQLGFASSPEWHSPSPSPKVVTSLSRKGVTKLSLSRNHSVALTEEGELYATTILDDARLVDRCKFTRMQPKLPIKDAVATPVDSVAAIDLSGVLWRWDPNTFDEPHQDDTLETRHLHQIATGIEHTAIIGTINKAWRTQAVEQATAAAQAATKK